MRFSDEAAIESGGPAQGISHDDASQERPQEQSQSNILEDEDDDDMAFDNSKSPSEDQPT